MRLTWRKFGIGLAAGLGLWLAGSGTAFAQEGPSVEEIAVGLDTLFLMIAAALVFFMQAGFAMLTAGLTRSKNTANILFKNLMDFVMCSLAFWAVGWGIAYGTSAGGFIGTGSPKANPLRQIGAAGSPSRISRPLPGAVTGKWSSPLSVARNVSRPRYSPIS